MRKAAFLLALTLLVSGANGCQPTTSPPAEPAAAPEPESPAEPESPVEPESPAEPAEPTAAAEPASATESAGGVTIAAWEEIVETVSRSGKPAVLDVWSLVCQPCLEEFPGLVRLDAEFGEQVACYSADVDFDGRKTRPPESYRQRVNTFLRDVDAIGAFPHYISSTSSDEIYRRLDIDSIPTVVVWNADGTIAKKFVDAGETAGFTYEDDIIPFVQTLLQP